MWEILPVGVLLTSETADVAVVVAAGPGRGGVAGGARAPRRMAVHPPVHAHTLLTHTHRVGEGLPVHKHTVLKGTVWTFRTASPWWCVWVSAVEWWAGPLQTLHRTVLTGADVTGLIGGGEPLSVAVDTVVVGTTLTHCTAGPGVLGGMEALGGGALCVCTHRLSVNTRTAGAGALRLPPGPLLIFLAIQHTRFTDGTAVVRVLDRVRALNWRTPLGMTDHITSLTAALHARPAAWRLELMPVSIYSPVVLALVTTGAALSPGLSSVTTRQRGTRGIQTLTGHFARRAAAAEAGVSSRGNVMSVQIHLRLVVTLCTGGAAVSRAMHRAGTGEG